MRQCCLTLIHCYRFFFSPFFGKACRFYPTCSQYAEELFTTHPLHKAFYFAGRRLLRCHPFCHGGHDPVPTYKIK